MYNIDTLLEDLEARHDSRALTPAKKALPKIKSVSILAMNPQPEELMTAEYRSFQRQNAGRTDLNTTLYCAFLYGMQQGLWLAEKRKKDGLPDVENL